MKTPHDHKNAGLRGLQPRRLTAGCTLYNRRKISRATGKSHRLWSRGMRCCCMTASGQRNRKQRLPVSIHTQQAIAVIGQLRRCQESRIAQRGPAEPRQQSLTKNPAITLRLVRMSVSIHSIKPGYHTQSRPQLFTAQKGDNFNRLLQHLYPDPALWQCHICKDRIIQVSC
jgi:hypothetical protein